MKEAWSGYATVELAIDSKTPIRADYGNKNRVLCPHAVGWKNTRLHVLCYQSGGESASGLSANLHDNWRCLNLAKMSRIRLARGEPWRTADSHRGASTCIDEIIAQVSVARSRKDRA